MHVAVRKFFGVKQRADVTDLVNDLRIGIPDLHAAKKWQVRRETSVALHRIQDVVVVHAVAAARLEVLDAVRGRAVHDTGAVLERDVIAEINGRCTVVEWMREHDPFERSSIRRRYAGAFHRVAFQARVHQLFRDDQMPARRAHQCIGEFRVHVQRLVRRYRPRRGRPDHGVKRTVRRRIEREGTREFFALACEHQRESDVDRRVDAIFVFDFRFGERTVTIKAPIDRLQTAIQITALEELAEGANLVGLALVLHRRVRMIPIAEHAEALKLRPLPRDLLGRIRAAEPLRLRRRQVLAVGLFDLHFDRHAVTVPTRDVGRIEARHRFALDDEVFQDLVERRTDMDVAVRVRRPVVQDETRPALRRGAYSLVDAVVVPLAHPHGLALREIAAHRERRVRQVQRGLVVAFGIVGHASSWAKNARACSASA